MRVRETKRRNKGKPVLAYDVVWTEPVRDHFGVPVPENPDRPNGPKRMRPRQETYAVRAIAQARVDELNAAKHTTGTSALADTKAKGEQPFGFYAKGWLQQQEVKAASGKLKRDTVDEYARQLRTYVLPMLGGMATASISPARVEELLAALVRQTSRQGDRKPLTPGTVKHIWDVTRRVFKYARQHGAIAANPCEAVDFSTTRATGDLDGFEHNPLTAEQVGQLSAAIAGEVPGLPAYPVYGLMVEFMAYSGLRAAEVSGLEVGDVVLPGAGDSRCTVRVRRTKERKAGQWVTGTLKSKRSRRDVKLPPWLSAKFVDYVQKTHPRSDEPTAPLWPSRKNGGGYRAKGQRYAVPLDWSQPLAMGAFYDTIFKPALEAVGLPASRPATATKPAVRGTRLHDLRHTFAVMHLSEGTHFMRVSQLLGHATYTLTLDTYGDWIPAEQYADDLPEPPAPVEPTVTPDNVVQLFGRKSS
ncbi:site-specific integrase [Mycolicibacterium tusciae]|uniref:tyrosine-type recombinase/integrase n=1 Tax=Mycolicibacterium tusciae TaxID=75922 RepID=UPI0030146F98